MENRIINLEVVAEIAKALKHYKNKVVFVGGAVVSLYADDKATDEIRPTADIDLTLNLVNLNKWASIQTDLAKLGFHPDPFGHSICSYKYKDIPIDIMAAEDGPLGPTNRWYKVGFKNLWRVKVKNEFIKILKAPCYLATKFEAFNNRGKDFRTSHDMEDIVYILDNRKEIVKEVKGSPVEVKEFIQSELKKIIKRSLLNEILEAHIHPLIIEQRIEIVKDRIFQIIE